MTTRTTLLIHPPVAKPAEPPPGLAKLAFALRARGVDCRVYDANLDGLLNMVAQPLAAGDRWTRRALAHRETHLGALRSPGLYAHRDRYKRAVGDINRILAVTGRPYHATISLANFTTPDLAPVRSSDLIRAAEDPEANPFFPIFSRRLLELFDRAAPDVVGLSINFMSQALGAFAMIGFIRRHLPHADIICGGGLVTSWLRIPAWRSPFDGLVDELIGGPGERRLVERCTGSDDVRFGVGGYDYSPLPVDRYLSPMRILPYGASKGCYWKRCAFCPEKAQDEPYATAPPQAILADLQRTAQQSGAGMIHFLDNALSPRLMAQLIAHPPPCPWYGFARITRHLGDPDFARGLKASGCAMLKLGVESADQRVLDALSKGTDIEMVSRALKTLHRAGIATYVYLLFGTPAENAGAAVKTLAFTQQHADHIDFLNLAIFNLPAYSGDAARLDTSDFYDGDLSLYREFRHPFGWNRNRVRRFLSKTFKKSAGIRAILNNDPPYFTANHAPFCTWVRR